MHRVMNFLCLSCVVVLYFIPLLFADFLVLQGQTALNLGVAVCYLIPYLLAPYRSLR